MKINREVKTIKHDEIQVDKETTKIVSRDTEHTVVDACFTGHECR